MANFAEVIESSLCKLKGQTWKWDDFPEYGSLVTITNESIKMFSIVYNIEAGSIDQSRIPFPYQKTEKQLLEEQPHIFEFLSTSFFCLTIGYQETNNNKIIYQIAPKPPKIHSFISHTSKKEIEHFFSSSQFLQLIFNYKHQLGNIDELLLAIFKNLSNYDMLDNHKLSQFIETINILTGNDYRRLKLFLQRVEPLIAE